MEITNEVRKNGNKQSQCSVYGKYMRSDVLQRHSKTHKDLLSMPEEEVREELHVRHRVELELKAKRQRGEEIAHQEDLPIPREIADKPFEYDQKDLREDIYLNKIELGKKIADIMEQGVICEER